MTKVHMLPPPSNPIISANNPSSATTIAQMLNPPDKLHMAEDGSSDSCTTQENSSSITSLFSHDHSASSSSTSSSLSVRAEPYQNSHAKLRYSLELDESCTSDEEGSFNGSQDSSSIKVVKRSRDTFVANKQTAFSFARHDADFVKLNSGINWEGGDDAKNSRPSSRGTQDKKMMLPIKPVLCHVDLSSEQNAPCFQRSASCKSQDSTHGKSMSKADVLKVDITNLQTCISKGLRNMQHVEDNVGTLKRYGSQGPASQTTNIRTFPSPGTPSRSSFSGIPTSYMAQKAYMLGRMGMYEKPSPLYSLPSGYDQDNVRIGAINNPRTLPSKWDDAEKWLVNASPSHPQSQSKSPAHVPESKKSSTHKGARLKPKKIDIPNPLSSCDRFQSATTMSDSEVSNTQCDDCRVFVRSSSQKHKESSAKPKNVGRKMVKTREDLQISSPTVIQLEQLKASRNYQDQPNDNPRVHDVHAVETSKYIAGAPCTSSPPGINNSNRLVVQAPKNKWTAPMRDAATEVSPKVSRRDMGTQITPMGSSRTSTSTTPLKSNSPIRHNTPTKRSSSWNCINQASSMLELESCHIAKLEHRELKLGDTKELSGPAQSQGQDAVPDTNIASANASTGPENDMSNLIKPPNYDMAEGTIGSIDEAAAYTAWEDAERTKYMAKYAREEARIDAWENHQKAKAEAELKKLEMKLERLRAQTTEKVMGKIVAAHRRAEEMRAAARAQQAEQLAKSLDRATHIRKNGYLSEALGVCFSKLS